MSGIIGLYDNSTFNLLNNAKLFSRVTEPFYIPNQQGMRALISPHPCQNLLLSILLWPPSVGDVIWHCGSDLYFSSN